MTVYPQVNSSLEGEYITVRREAENRGVCRGEEYFVTKVINERHLLLESPNGGIPLVYRIPSSCVNERDYYLSIEEEEEDDYEDDYESDDDSRDDVDPDPPGPHSSISDLDKIIQEIDNSPEN